MDNPRYKKFLFDPDKDRTPLEATLNQYAEENYKIISTTQTPRGTLFIFEQDRFAIEMVKAKARAELFLYSIQDNIEGAAAYVKQWSEGRLKPSEPGERTQDATECGTSKEVGKA